MKESRLKSWGFEEFPTEDPRIINYIGLESPENKITSYEIFPGVIVLYISLKKKYNANNSSAKGNRGYRIGYCYEGNYFTYINTVSYTHLEDGTYKTDKSTEEIKE